MKLEDLEAKLGIADMGEEAKLALVKDIQANLPALKAEQRALEAKTQANLVVEAIKKIKEGLEARFDELNGIVDVKVRDITSGKDGIDGKDGKDGVDGKDGKDGLSITGPKGADGQNGEDGVGVQDAHIDFDGSLIITLTDGRELNVGEVVPFDVAEKIKVIGNGGGTSQSVLDAITALTLATTANAAITGGTINGATIGATTAAAGTFTTLIGGGGSANYFQTQGATTTKAVEVKALGSDTNIAFVIDSKGTGAIDLAAGSSGVNISNGGTVTALTVTATGSGYTSIPSVSITAPTTAGGVQATATIAMAQATTAIAGGGTSYTVNDVLTFVGGTGVAITITVTSVSAGVITGFTVSNGGSYTVLPTNPVSVTGGTGTGATFNVTSWQLRSGGFTITNAGSGYVEQPTVSFSGGGGSGAAAYATVGSNTVQKTIGNIHTFATPNSNVLALVDKNASGNYPTNSSVAFAMIPQQSAFGASYFGFGSAAYLGTASTASSAFQFATSVSSPVSNGGGGSTQLQIAHTASAVNYVQVTGAATGAQPSISAQGSDTSISMSFSSKGAGQINFWSNNFATRQFSITNTNSAVNRLDVTGSIAGAAPVLSAQGSDTNIDLTLTPKGTGRVQFGTFTANMALTVQGYIEIKDSGGTVRKLAVIA